MVAETELFYAKEVRRFHDIFSAHAVLPDNTSKQDRAAFHNREVDDARTVELSIFRQLSENAAPSDTNSITGQKFEPFHPVALASALISNNAFSAADTAHLMRIMEKSFPLDATTGFYAKQTMPLLLGLAHLHAQQSETPLSVFLVEGDFSNMGGANTELGRDVTDKLIYKTCAIVNESLKGQAISVQPIRAGGDEVRFVVYAPEGTQKEAIESVLRDQVHPALNLLSAQMGVHTTPHTKKGKPPGYGAAFAVVDLKEDKTLDEFRRDLETGITIEKQIDGFLRFGLTRESDIDRYIATEFTPYFSELHGHAPEAADIQAKKEQLRQITPQIEARWQKLIAPGGAYHNEYLATGADSPQAFFDAQEARHPEIKREIAAITFTPAQDIIPFSSQDVTYYDEGPDVHRLRETMHVMGFDQIAHSDAPVVNWNIDRQLYELNRPMLAQGLEPSRGRVLRMTIDLMGQFDKPDPVARCKPPTLMLEDARMFMEQYGGMREIEISVANLNGVNNINATLGDALVRESRHIIQSSLQNHSEGRASVADYLYHKGGGNFSVFLPPDYPDAQLQALAQDIETGIETHISSKTIEQFARDTYARTRPIPGSAEAANSKIALLGTDIASLNKKLTTPLSLDSPMRKVPHPKDKNKHIQANLLVTEIAPGANIAASFKRAAAQAEELFEVSWRSTVTLAPQDVGVITQSTGNGLPEGQGGKIKSVRTR